MLRVVVLGAAAGGGFPQWNCNCNGCRRARAGDPLARPRTQASVAVTADGRHWVLLNASPDLPHQLLSTPQLHPQTHGRHSPLTGVVLTGAEVDVVAGLLSLRERHGFSLYAPDAVIDVLSANPIFAALDPSLVPRVVLQPDTPTPLAAAGGTDAGLVVEAFAVPGKVPLYLEGADGGAGSRDGHSIGLAISAAGESARLIFVPGCAAITADLVERIEGCALLMFDGTVWHDDDLARAGVGEKTGRRMGHVPMWGDDGSIALLAGTAVGRRALIHINNTNPVLLEDSAEHAAARAAGWEIPADGTEYVL